MFSFAKAMRPFLVFAVVIAINMVSAPPVDAAISKPDGALLLIVSGNIKQTNVGEEAHLDRQMLQSVGMKKLTTSNQFEPGIHNYEGILLKDLLAYLGASGSTLIATALDGYSVEFPVEEVQKYPVILAMYRNGKQMTVRDRGPIWIIYPLDQFEELKDEKYSSRSIWQLNRLVVQ